jgi:hypothetical protein
MLTPLVIICSPCFFLIWRAISSVVVRGCHGADAPLLVGVRLQTFVDRRFVQDLIREYRPAMRTQHQTALMQFIQIVADCDCRRAKPPG